ncbi:MAG: metallophosphoesterase family protein [Desulfonatronovibrio sp.]
MRIAVFSDIHGNIEAFRQVLRDADSRNVQACYFLGDAISYGPEPELCVRLLHDKDIPCVLGNHELALIQPGMKNYFNHPTRLHFDQAVKLLSQYSLSFISTWPQVRKEHGMLLVHGCPPDSVTRYLFDIDDKKLLQIIADVEQSMVFVGHTHELEMISCTRSEITRQRISRGIHELKGEKILINAGSVGQPRDGDNRAKYVIWDQAKQTVEVCFVEYNIEKTIQGIYDRGFPEFFALRLR